MNSDILQSTIESVTSFFTSLASPNILVLLIFLNFILSYYLVRRGKTSISKLEIWQYYTYSTYILFLLLYISYSITENTGNPVLNTVFAIVALVIGIWLIKDKRITTN